MARKARIRSTEGIYHVSSHSIRELDMFQRDEDKDYFLTLLSTLISKYEVKIYAYCLMSNHYHLIIDTCGLDISKLMMILNLRYVKYINKKYNRRGPLLDGRFFSKPVNNMNYLIYLSAYIHNNPKDLPGFKNLEEEYKYSSLHCYFEKEKATASNPVNPELILDYLDNDNLENAKAIYKKMINYQKRIADYDDFKGIFDNLGTKSSEIPKRNIPHRNFDPVFVMESLCGRLGISYNDGLFKNSKNSTLRKIAAYLLSIFSSESTNSLTRYFGVIKPDSLLNLAKQGYINLENNSALRNSLIKCFYP